MNFETSPSPLFIIPAGLHQLLHRVTVAILRAQPPDLYDFVTDYFDARRAARRAGRADWETMDWQPMTSPSDASTRRVSSKRSLTFDTNERRPSTQLRQLFDVEVPLRTSIARRISILNSVRRPSDLVIDGDDEDGASADRGGYRDGGDDDDVGNDGSGAYSLGVKHPKSDRTRERLKKLVQNIPVFRYICCPFFTNIIIALHDYC